MVCNDNESILRWMENTSSNGYGRNHAWKHSKDMDMDARNQTKLTMQMKMN